MSRRENAPKCDSHPPPLLAQFTTISPHYPMTTQLPVTNWQMGPQEIRWPAITRASGSTREHLAKSGSLEGEETNLTGSWAGSTAVYWWKTVCERKSCLKTSDEVWQVPVPKAALCWKKTHGPLKTEQPKGYHPRALLRQQREKFPIQGGGTGTSYHIFKRRRSSRYQSSPPPRPRNVSFGAICTAVISYHHVLSTHKPQAYSLCWGHV